MLKKMIPIYPDTARSEFSWIRDPEFTPPGQGGGVEVCLTHEFTAPRIGELKTLLEVFLANALKIIGASAGLVRLISPDGLSLPIISSAGFCSELQTEAENFTGLDCEASDISNLNQTIQISDISNCKLRQHCQHTHCSFQALITTPLESFSTHNTPLGILTLFFTTTPEAASLAINHASAFAEAISAAVEHSYVNRETQRIERLAARLAIANDIHDSLAQTLTYARMRVSLLLEASRNCNNSMLTRYAGDLDDALEIAQKSARELVKGFRCEMNHGGLSVALHELATEFCKRNKIVLEYHNRLVDLELPLEHEIQTYYIVHEALNNIARHSGATHARLFVDTSFGYYVFTVEDNGIGASTFSPVEGHYGMMIMRERAHKIGGTIKVESHAGQGTHLQLFFPKPSMDWRATQ
ncbi:MAG: ATP-binding protein [Proteobacteria bacterium]|nr:ATP-binding protein [Pseudomonadota bacterium]